MPQKFSPDSSRETHTCWTGPSEPESHIEHQAALDATLFHERSATPELVFELDAGQLRVRPPR